MKAKAHIGSHPLHPILVMFPLALWITSVILDIIGVVREGGAFWAAGFFLIIGGCIGAVLAALPGVIDLFGVVPPNSSGRRRGYLHGGLNVLALALWIAVAAYRGDPATRPDGLSLLLSAIGVAGVLYTGWLGGTLVYRNQIGVDHRYANAGKYKEREVDGWDKPLCNQSELTDGQMLLAEVEGERVVVGRCPEKVAAFSDRCTHKGGPLSDGALVGCTVQCPWHGSQFDIHSGRVVAGPAERKIESYESEVRRGEVYVKPKGGDRRRAA